MNERNGWMTKFTADLQGLVGKQCWGIVCGSRTGGDLSFEIGARRKRSQAVQSREVSDETSEYQGEASVFVQCAWRIESDGKVLGGSADSEEMDGRLTRAAMMLRGASISEVFLSQPFADLRLTLSSGLALRIFCDSSFTEDIDQYSVTFSQVDYVVGGLKGLRLEHVGAAAVVR